ncbi:MAG: sulfatase-like hydrolase/transferase [Deltaproteobacteria bacterium]|nr:sulfatase-like hydrolase/transferase [Deltaproteobacteria bacterium]
MRLHAAVFGLLSVLALHQLVRRISTPRAAFFSGLALLTSYQFVYKHSARTGEAETLVCFALIMTAWSFVSAVFDGRSFVWHFVWVAILANLKSPLILIPLIAGAGHLMLSAESRPLMRRWISGMWVLPLGLLWHIGQLFYIGAEGQAALFAMFQKLSAGETGAESGPRWWFNLTHYAKVTLYGAFPYSIAYPLALLGLVRADRDPLQDRKLGVLALYVAVIYGFFLLVRSHHPWYVLPALPFLSALLGIWLDRIPSGQSPRWIRASVIVVAVLTAGVQIVQHNPFAVRGLIPSYSLVQWRSFAPYPSIMVLLVVAAVTYAALQWSPKRVLPGLGDRALAIIALILFGSGLWRVLEPLADVDYQSDIARLKIELDAKRGRGETIEYPIRVPTRGFFMVRYYFGDEYEIVETPGNANRGFRYLLIGEGSTPHMPPPYAGPSTDATMRPAPLGNSSAPNIILYIVDTLRADALGPYGNERVDTPAMDTFAREGTVFDNAYSQSSWTRASMASLLTSTYPAAHGAVDRADLLSESSLMLSEILGREGYHTGILTTNPNIGSFFGFDQGFDDFVELYARREVGRVAVDELETSAADVVRSAAEWIRAAPEPYLLVVLAIDPHSPYTPPSSFDRYAGDYSGPLDGTKQWINRKQLSSAEKSRVRSLYLGEVSYSDSAFGTLLRQIDEMDARDKTIVALTSDHGEEFWEHGARGHGKTLFEETLRIPLILRYPPAVEAGRRVVRTVESIDIVPTLLELAGVSVPDVLDGRSLLSPQASDRAGLTYSSLQLQDHRLEAVRDDDWKWIWRPDTQRGALYDLSRSESEAEDVSDAHPEVVARMRALLADHRERVRVQYKRLHPEMDTPSIGDAEIPAEDRALLKHLGYIDEE